MRQQRHRLLAFLQRIEALQAARHQPLVQSIEVVQLRDRHHELAPRRLHQGLDLALVVALAGPAEAVAEQIMRLQMRKRLGAPPRAVAQDPRHRKGGVVVQDRSGDTAEEGEGADMTVQEGLRRLPRIGLDEPDVRMGQDQAEEGDLLPTAPQLDHRLAEVDLGMARRVMQRHEGLARRLPPGTDIVLHDGIAAGEPVLVP